MEPMYIGGHVLCYVRFILIHNGCQKSFNNTNVAYALTNMLVVCEHAYQLFASVFCTRIT